MKTLLMSLKLRRYPWCCSEIDTGLKYHMPVYSFGEEAQEKAITCILVQFCSFAVTIDWNQECEGKQLSQPLNISTVARKQHDYLVGLFSSRRDDRHEPWYSCLLVSTYWFNTMFSTLVLARRESGWVSCRTICRRVSRFWKRGKRSSFR